MVIYSVNHKRVFTPLRDLPTRIIEAIDHFSDSTMAFAFTENPRIFCKCKCHCWVWRMVDSLYYLSRKISERCENSFVNYRIYYQKLCYLMRQITKDLNWPTVWTGGCNGVGALVVKVTPCFLDMVPACVKIIVHDKDNQPQRNHGKIVVTTYFVNDGVVSRNILNALNFINVSFCMFLSGLLIALSFNTES